MLVESLEQVRYGIRTPKVLPSRSFTVQYQTHLEIPSLKIKVTQQFNLDSVDFYDEPKRPGVIALKMGRRQDNGDVSTGTFLWNLHAVGAPIERVSNIAPTIRI